MISTDVFDTLLLRRIRSERSRIARGERLFGKLLASRGWRIDHDLLISARLDAQRLAFRALDIRGAGEVRLTDIIVRQLHVLGLPSSLLDERLNIELQVEKASLVANRPLAAILRARRHAGAKIIAVSDTTLSAQALAELIRHFHGPNLIDRVYSSADHGRTKRDGDLFLTVAEMENTRFDRILHIGDDLRADVRTPSNHGISVVHLPRPPHLRYGRMADAALAEARRIGARRARVARAAIPKLENAFDFGKFVLGPIVTQFCLRIWLYAAQVETCDRASLLFCARGGIGIREVFERVLARLGLPLSIARENVMISRLIAARAALLVQSRSALEELGREFRGGSFADVAKALGGRTYQLSPEWQQPFAANRFAMLLFGRSGSEVLADIEQQNALFVRHFAKLRGDAARIVLCDTGLYGSTQRLLAHAFPALRIETIQFARANYKGHGEEHFPKVAGLLVEQNYYSPFDVHSCVLRYWHLIESLFEPKIPSVRTFAEGGPNTVTANCGEIGYGSIDPSRGNSLLSGALSYVDSLAIGGGTIALRDAEAAWFCLKRAITRPTPDELRCLEVGGRSVDFGRSDMLRVLSVASPRSWLSRLASVRTQLWREGAIAREFPVLRYALLPMLESAYSLRGMFARQR
ncbi:hydrolase [Bradyrhizobium sp. ARR65]|uniref:hydrolase n=1 Tax=Bradyrhizobium sp. ARR65 TaxID=1040989 RepID=UPI0032DF7315